ncbi:MAG TPA: hypothetical protein VMR59_01125 [Patescibacteria group bacterium]|jgi:hypothetical protein|nr:hypothetical protein [Patescibacteria group bacterium]
MNGPEGKYYHYSDQPGHALRSAYHKVEKRLGGTPPNSIPGYGGIEQVRRRRSMRRITDCGK